MVTVKPRGVVAGVRKVERIIVELPDGTTSQVGRVTNLVRAVAVLGPKDRSPDQMALELLSEAGLSSIRTGDKRRAWVLLRTTPEALREIAAAILYATGGPLERVAMRVEGQTPTE